MCEGLVVDHCESGNVVCREKNACQVTLDLWFVFHHCIQYWVQTCLKSGQFRAHVRSGRNGAPDQSLALPGKTSNIKNSVVCWDCQV